MLADNLLEKIGFTESMIQKYYKYINLFSDKLEQLCELAVKDEIGFNSAYMQVRELVPELNVCTSDLFFVLNCTGYLHKKYNENNISDDIFYSAMVDLRCKTEECQKVYGIFGITVIDWYEKFLKIERLAFGRLQFDIDTYSGEPINIDGVTIQQGDFVMYCHIPSSGPLLRESCIESYKMAYQYFSDNLRNGILPIFCNSWLLFPTYKKIFSENSKNIFNFIQDYHIHKIEDEEFFNDFWRVFNRTFESCKEEGIPEDTRLQRAFAEHIRQAGKFGCAIGILLFDGTEILTQNNS